MEKDPDNMIGGVQNGPTMPASPCPITLSYTKLSQWSSSLLSRYCSHQVFWCQADNKGKTLRYHIKRGGGGGVCRPVGPFTWICHCFSLVLARIR